MRPKEYFHQAYRLDQRINSHLAELKYLREMAYNVSSSGVRPQRSGSRSNEAPFMKGIEHVMAFEEKINAEVYMYISLKEQIRSAIDKVENIDECLVLRYRYIHNYTWEQIGNELKADKSTIRRWHGKALRHITLPENIIFI